MIALDSQEIHSHTVACSIQQLIVCPVSNPSHVVIRFLCESQIICIVYWPKSSTSTSILGSAISLYRHNSNEIEAEFSGVISYLIDVKSHPFWKVWEWTFHRDVMKIFPQIWVNVNIDYNSNQQSSWGPRSSHSMTGTSSSKGKV